MRKVYFDTEAEAIQGKLAVKNEIAFYRANPSAVPANVVDVVKWLATGRKAGFRKGDEEQAGTIKQLVDKYIAKRTADHKEKGKPGVKRLRDDKWMVDVFRKWCGDDEPIATALHEITLKEYADYVRGRWDSGNTHRLAFQSLKMMIKWAWSKRYLAEMPRNLDSDDFDYTAPEPEPNPMTLEHFTYLYKEAPPAMRLYMMLGLNCGYTQVDISTLTHSMIDWDTEIIDRTRHKTENGAKCQQRSTLWTHTLSLLKEQATEPNEQGSNPALLSKDGNELLRREDDTDVIGLAFRRLKNKETVTTEHTFRDFRSTGANEIENGYQPATRIRTNTELADMFLAHKRQGMIKHYTVPDLTELGHAANWLGDKVERAFRDAGIAW